MKDAEDRRPYVNWFTLVDVEMIGAFEAKTQLSALLDRVAKGERTTITRHGVPAALLVPPVEPGLD